MHAAIKAGSPLPVMESARRRPPCALPPAGNIGPISAAGILFSGISFLILQGDERRYVQKTEDIGGVGQV